MGEGEQMLATSSNGLLAYIYACTLLLMQCPLLAMAAPECRWGASYWCQSKAIAEQCGQVAYCEKEVWKVRRSKLNTMFGNGCLIVSRLRCQIGLHVISASLLMDILISC